MDADSTFSQLTPPVFDGDNYQHRAIRIQAYLEGLDLWEAVEEDYQVPPLPPNPTMAQLKNNKEQRMRKSKAKAVLFSAVAPTIFTRIMSLKSAKAIWDYLKEEFAGDERIKGMKVLNLVREFELLRMKDTDSIQVYTNKLLGIVNKTFGCRFC
jgi:hypothetical protein